MARNNSQALSTSAERKNAHSKDIVVMMDESSVETLGPNEFARLDALELPWYLRREYYTDGWTDQSVWRSAIAEGVAALMLSYLCGQFGITIMSLGTKEILAYVGVFNSALLAIFIWATAPVSGGFINPLITWTAMLCGQLPAAKGTLYIAFQSLGGAVAGALLVGSWGYERGAVNLGGGCFFDPAILTPGQAFLTEVVCSWIMMYLGFGVGLDPRQGALFGPRLGPALVGICLGVVTSSTTGVATGYGGANMNPSRCLALSIARSEYSYHWMWWIGPAVGGVLHALLYRFAPPYHAEKRAARSMA